MAKIVMFWDCPYCGTNKIPGYNLDCEGGCDHPRSKNVHFYHSNPPTVATPEQAALFGKPDPNWYCESCDSGNYAEKDKCWKCGTPRTAKSSIHEVRVYHEKDLPFSAAEAEEAEKRIPAEPQTPWVPKEDPYNPTFHEPQSYRTSDRTHRESPSPVTVPTQEYGYSHISTHLKGILAFISVFVGFILAGFLIYNFFFRTHVENVVVQAMEWSQTVRIEEFLTFHESGWDVPSGGRQTDSTPKKRGEDKIHDGWTTDTVPDTCYGTRTVPDTCTGSRSVPDTCYRTNGDGSADSYSCSKSESYTYSCTTTESYSYSCTKQVQRELYHMQDVIDDWYKYDIERWATVGTYPTSGTGLEVYYDKVQPGQNQRRIQDVGRYLVTYGSSDIKPFTREYDKEMYMTCKIGQSHEVLVNPWKVVLELR